MPDLRRAGELAREEKALATRRAYRSDFRVFKAWCQGRGVSALPAAAEAVAAFLAHDVEVGSRPSTLGRRLAAIRYAHKLAGHSAQQTTSGPPRPLS
jgi:site-specific recombinase XerD